MCRDVSSSGIRNGALQLDKWGRAGELPKMKLKARVNRSDARAIRQALEQRSAKGAVSKAGDEFVVNAEMKGTSARG